MQDVVEEPRPTTDRTWATGQPVPLGHTYAEPLAGLRVSWGSVLAGTVAMLAVSLILWALALAVISLTMHPTAASLGGSAMALSICAIATTLVGAFVGGWIAGYLPGNARPGIAVVHGFLSWCVALLVAFGIYMVVLRGLLGTAGAVISSGPPDADLLSAEREILTYVRDFGWCWFGTWFVAALLAVGGAALAARRLKSPGPPVPPGEARQEPLFERPREAPREPPFGSSPAPTP